MSHFKNLNSLLYSVVYHTSALWSDKAYLKVIYFLKFGKKLNLNDPVTFSEKMQWLKLYNHNPEFIIMADKVKAKDWVAKKIGENYIIPTLGVWESADDIDFSFLPNKFVIKCNHNSGTGMFICKDKALMDENKVRTALAKGLKENYFIQGREWPYKDIPRRIIAEEFLENKECSGDLPDYKFFCFNGKVEFFKVDFDRFTNHRANYFSPDGMLLNFGEAEFPPKPENKIEKNQDVNKMIELAEKLSHGFSFLRVDFYLLNHKIYFGELTFFPNSGLGKWTQKDTDNNLGQLIKI